MEINLSTYKDKVYACFLGKNIGGTLGAPFECYRGVFDVDYYTQDLKGKPAPNDDLDLQLVWLNAVERYSNHVNADILGEYWLSFITPNWSEYGAGKNNMRMGLIPPLSGYVNNLNRDSCGAFIRSELWACLAPGHPQIAVKYALEDSCVDHSNEGVYAAVFTAALQSAAFAEIDREHLIEIGLSYIPSDSAVSRAVRRVAECYHSGVGWQETREILLNEFPSAFGLLNETGDTQDKEIPGARIGYDAPCNIGLTMLGWYYGEGDFGKSVCLAASCGEDADCTAATLGALLGIILGTQGIDQKWVEPIGNHIETKCINTGDRDCKIPKTIDELTDRILRQTPVFLGPDICDTINTNHGYVIKLPHTEMLYNTNRKKGTFATQNFLQVLKRQPFSVHYQNPVFNTTLNYHDAPYISPNCEKKLTIHLENQFFSQQYVHVRWIVPEGFSVFPAESFSLPLEQYHANIGNAEVECTISVPETLYGSKYELILELSANARHTKTLIPVTFLNAPIPKSDR